MKQTYLLIEVYYKVSSNKVIEDIHGVSDSIDTLKEVAVEENDGEPLEWKRQPMGLVPYAKRTAGKPYDNLIFQIMKTNNYA
jgi:hypothetical protein